MKVYLSLVRGINVGGRKKVRMEELKQRYESLGFGKVRTYIQSGSVIFESSSTDVPNLVNKIEKEIRDHFGFGALVMIRTKDELTRLVKAVPFKGRDESKFHVTFLSARPAHVPLEEIQAAADAQEDFFVAGTEIYLSCPNGNGRTKLSNGFFERKLKVSATTRNWRTVKTLLSMANQ
jgi:uncharacterized protein (DUF1697 family)